MIDPSEIDWSKFCNHCGEEHGPPFHCGVCGASLPAEWQKWRVCTTCTQPDVDEEFLGIIRAETALGWKWPV
jgi:hypothetical protein